MMPYRRSLWVFVGTFFWSIVGIGALIGAEEDYSDNSCVQEKSDLNDHRDACEDEADAYRKNYPDVYQDYCWYGTEPETDCEFARKHGLWGIFMPEGPPLYRPMMADPRELTYSVGWRFNDKVIERNVIDVSFYDRFPIFRWCDLWKWRGDLQIELEGGVWAIFDPLHDSSPLVDADYYVGVPITYAFDNWAIRLRGYHISTHIGDEFLLNHPHFDRRNPSIEAFDLFVSNQFTRDIRLYGGIGYIACQDDSFRVGKLYLQAGLELRLFEFGYYDYCNRFYGVPIFGMNFFYNSKFENHVNQTYVLGYEWGKFSGDRHKFRIFLEYHDGYSLDGQFCCFPTHYFSIRASYGY